MAGSMYSKAEKVDAQKRYYARGRSPDRRRIKPGRHRAFEVEVLWDIHQEIARLLVLGFKNVEIAKKLNCSKSTISNVRNSEVVKEHIAMLQGVRNAEVIDIVDDIKKFAPTCVNLLKEVVKNEVEGAGADITLRSRTAENLLDRAGYAAPKAITVDTSHIHTFMTKEDLNEIVKVAKARKIVEEITDGNTVDGEFEEVENAS